MTRQAFGIDQWTNRDYSGTAPLTEAALRLEADTFANARLWDYRPLEVTLDQLQTVRQYYDFVDVDTDRYTVDGELRQVMLSGRELAIEKNPQATGWVNQRVIYTHGIGMAMVPVNEVTPEGQPPPLDQGPAAGLGAGGARDHRAPHLLRRERRPLRGGRGAPGGVRLSAAGRDHHRRRDHALDRHDRHRARHDAHATPVRPPVQGPGPPDLGPDHGRQPAPVPPDHQRAAEPGRPVPALRQGPVPRHRRRRALRLRAGRLHDQRRLPQRAGVQRGRARRRVGPGRRGPQLHPEQRQDHDGRLRRHDALLRRRSVRPDHPGLAGRLPRARSSRSSAMPSGLVAHLRVPEELFNVQTHMLRPVPRRRQPDADVLQQHGPVDDPGCPDQRAEPPVRGLLRGDADARRRRTWSSSSSSR